MTLSLPHCKKVVLYSLWRIRLMSLHSCSAKINMNVDLKLIRIVYTDVIILLFDQMSSASLQRDQKSCKQLLKTRS